MGENRAIATERHIRLLDRNMIYPEPGGDETGNTVLNVNEDRVNYILAEDIRQNVYILLSITHNIYNVVTHYHSSSLAACGSNCKICNSNLGGKCDSGQCDARYAFDATLKTCGGRCHNKLTGLC